MQPCFNEHIEGPKVLELSPDGKRNLVGFFDLLTTVNKRLSQKHISLPKTQHD